MWIGCAGSFIIMMVVLLIYIFYICSFREPSMIDIKFLKHHESINFILEVQPPRPHVSMKHGQGDKILIRHAFGHCKFLTIGMRTWHYYIC